MQKKTHIKTIALTLVFLFSFVFQTAYSISFNVPQIQSSDLLHKHIDKSSAKEEISQSNFIEEETEDNNELDYETMAFILPSLYLQLNYTSTEVISLKQKNTSIVADCDLIIAIHSLRIWFISFSISFCLQL